MIKLIIFFAILFLLIKEWVEPRFTYAANPIKVAQRSEKTVTILEQNWVNKTHEEVLTQSKYTHWKWWETPFLQGRGGCFRPPLSWRVLCCL